MMLTTSSADSVSFEYFDQVVVEGDLRRGHDDPLLGPDFPEVAKLRRSMYGFCTRMNDCWIESALGQQLPRERTFSPVFVDWFSIRMLVLGTPIRSAMAAN